MLTRKRQNIAPSDLLRRIISLERIPKNVPFGANTLFDIIQLIIYYHETDLQWKGFARTSS